MGQGPARWRRAASTSATLAAFRLPGYLALWLSGSAWAFGSSVGVVAIGWATLVSSDSAFAVGAVFAARLVPSLVLGIPLGNLVDRLDRRATIIVSDLLGAVPLLAIGALALSGPAGVVELLVLSLVLGVVDTVRGTATQSYTYDLAGAAGATNAIALGNLGGFLLGIAGSLAGGLIVDAGGAASAFFTAAGASLLAGTGLALAGRRIRPAAADGHSGAGGVAPRVAPTLRQSLSLIVRNRAVGLIALIVIVAEILGFSAATLFPTFARDVLLSDASGLGALTGARYAGSIAGLLLLARIRPARRSGPGLLFATAGLGAGLVGFALSRSFVLSLLMLVVVGIASAGLDTLVQSLLQRSVHDSERGSAVGVWYFAIGFGPVGQLALGAAAGAIGAPMALAVSGALLAAIAVSLVRFRALRQLE